MREIENYKNKKNDMAAQIHDILLGKISYLCFVVFQIIIDWSWARIQCVDIAPLLYEKNHTEIPPNPICDSVKIEISLDIT